MSGAYSQAPTQRNLLIVLLLFIIPISCSSKENPTIEDFSLVSAVPEQNSVVSANIETITFTFNKGILEVNKSKITLNGVAVSEGMAKGAVLSVKIINLEIDTDYEVIIEKGAIKDNSKNPNNQPFSLKFKTEKSLSPTETIRLEAENAVITGGGSSPALIVNDPQCSNGKYVETQESNLIFSFAISQSGNYKVIAKTKTPSGEKYNKFLFDDEHTKDIHFPQNNAFEEVLIADPFYFAAGNHTIEMVKVWGWIQFDYLEISPSSSVATEFDIQPMVTPYPTVNTTKLFQFLLDNFQRKIISGVMTLRSLSTTTGDSQNEISWLFEKTGKKPALLGLDFMDHTGSFPTDWTNNPDIIQDAIYWKNNNGIVALCWHWRDPSYKTDDFYTERTSFDPRKIFEPQSEEYAAMMRDMDIVADYLKELQQNDVPILWRPLHEASGRWFWWGSQGAEACKKIWQIMFEKFTVEHEIKNLIWVWTSEANNSALSWYPGDEYVDIIGLDIYDEGNHGSQMMAFQELKSIFGGKKMLALSECGSIPAMEAMKKDKTIWSYYMPWYGEHTKDPKWNTTNDWFTSFSDPDVITLEDMPNF